MTPEIKEKFRKARHSLKKAGRELDSRNDLVRACRWINAALNRGMEAWLMQHDRWRDLLNDRDIMKSEFSAHAPRILRFKIFTTYHKAYTHGSYLYYHRSPDEIPEVEMKNWIERVRGFLSDAKQIVEGIQNNFPDEVAFPGVSPPEYRAGQWLIHSFRSGSNDLHCLCKVLSVDKHRGMVRDRERKIVFLDADWASLKPDGRPDDDMDLPFEHRRTWFDLHPEYRQVPLHFSSYGQGSAPWYFTCPCCGYPTLAQQQPGYDDDAVYYYDICPLCDWADQYGQDDWDADEVKGGANWDYTLTEARRNFDRSAWMFRPDEKNALIGITNQSLLDIRKTLRSKFDAMVEEHSPGKIYLLWCEIKRLWRGLDAELKRREEQFYHLSDKTDLEDTDKEKREVSYTPYRNDWLIRCGHWIEDLIDGKTKVLWAGYGIALVRHVDGKIREISSCGKELEMASGDMYSPFESRRAWFDIHPESNMNHYTCPCCGYPALSFDRSFETCFLCEWRHQSGDGRQDDHNENEVLGGPNGPYSLSNARRNFETFSTMFRPDDSSQYLQRFFQPEVVRIKKRIMSYFDTLITESDASKVKLLWSEIQKTIKEIKKN